MTPEHGARDRAAPARHGNDTGRRYDGVALDFLMVALDVIVITLFVVLAFVMQWSH